MQVVDVKIPDFKAPPLSCDCHLHVFGDPTRYPYSAARRNSPPTVPLATYLDDYLALAHRLGIERMVFVQPSTYGQDNSCLIDAMQVIGNKSRGIVDIDENISDAQLGSLHHAGVRGVRINGGPPSRPYEAGLAAKLLPRIERMDARCAEIGWHLDFLGPSWLYIEMMSTLKKLKSNFMLAHMAMFLAKNGTDQPGFKQLLDLLRDGNGRCWVKLTAPYRLSVVPDFVDVTPIAQALIAAAPQQIIWGSDYPYLSNADRVNSVELFNLIPQWAPDETIRNMILVDNPQRLFKF